MQDEKVMRKQFIKNCGWLTLIWLILKELSLLFDLRVPALLLSSIAVAMILLFGVYRLNEAISKNKGLNKKDHIKIIVLLILLMIGYIFISDIWARLSLFAFQSLQDDLTLFMLSNSCLIDILNCLTLALLFFVLSYALYGRKGMKAGIPVALKRIWFWVLWAGFIIALAYCETVQFNSISFLFYSPNLSVPVVSQYILSPILIVLMACLYGCSVYLGMCAVLEGSKNKNRSAEAN